MGIVKGCFNKRCIANQKKLTYKKTEGYCSKCGSKLYYVCRSKDCYTQLPDDSEKYCVRCLAKKNDNKHIRFKKGKKVVGALAAVGMVVVTVAKLVLKKD